MNEIDIKKLVSVNEYAKMRGVTRHTIYNWIKDGYDSNSVIIKSVIIGGKTFIQP